MTHAATAAVARYRNAARRITFDSSDKQEIYDLLGRAEALIARLDGELGKLAASEEPTGERVA